MAASRAPLDWHVQVTGMVCSQLEQVPTGTDAIVASLFQQQSCYGLMDRVFVLGTGEAGFDPGICITEFFILCSVHIFPSEGVY